MTTAEVILLFTALLVAPAAAIVGLGAGALFTYRVLKGMPPVPNLRPRPRPARPDDDDDEQRPRMQLKA